MPRGGNNSGGGGVIRGTKRADVLTGTSGDDVMQGRGGADVLSGGAGDDSLDGGAGADILIGGPGNDTATGGEGADIFVFAPGDGTLVITDFENGTDRIDVSAFGFDQSGQSPTYAGYLADLNGDTYLTFYDAGGVVGEIVLRGFDYTLIDPSDYIL